jgi:hypothetical protein
MNHIDLVNSRLKALERLDTALPGELFSRFFLPAENADNLACTLFTASK